MDVDGVNDVHVLETVKADERAGEERSSERERRLLRQFFMLEEEMKNSRLS